MAQFSGPVAVLADRKARPFWAGHRWVFSGALAHQLEGLSAGTVLELRDSRDQVLDFGLWSPRSALRIRLLGIGPVWPFEEATLPDSFWQERVASAVALRRRLGLPSAATDSYRLVNADGDGLPGLSVDRYGDGALMHLSSAVLTPYLGCIIEALRKEAGLAWLWHRNDATFAEREGYAAMDEAAFGEAPEELWVNELGLRYIWSPRSQQKTGHYCDQRENRAWFGELAKGARVFDAFCFSGGFGLAAARAGAASVLGVDSSEGAIAAARRNAAENGLAGNTEWVSDKVENRLRRAFDKGDRFDLISLDPPKLAPDRNSAEAGEGKQTSLCVEAFRVAAPDGLVLVSSCSSVLGEGSILNSAGDAAVRLGRRVDVVGVRGHAGDHPYVAAMPECRYLTAVLFRVR
jgi:23S rRNA (cytosine1962-C5)-methyltransferase